MRRILLLVSVFVLCCGCRTQSHIVIEKAFYGADLARQAANVRVRVEVTLTR